MSHRCNFLKIKYKYQQQTLSSTQHKMIFIDRDINDNWKRRLD